MATPDIVRGVLISLASMLFAGIIAATVQAWRQQSLPIPRRVPFYLTLLFIVGYLMLLADIVSVRWQRLGYGLPVDEGTYFSIVALLVNTFAVLLSVRQKRYE